MDSGQRITSLPVSLSPALSEGRPNPAKALQQFVGDMMAKAMAPVDALNMGLAKSTLGFVQSLPKFPAARLFGDLVFGWPHAHAHPPNLIPPAPPIPLPSIGPVICAGAVSVLINGLPSARVGDIGFGAWCGGFFPAFEVKTGSSHVFIGGARPARQLIDFTVHCEVAIPGLGKLGAAMMGLSAGMGTLGVAASLSDQASAAAAAASSPEAAMEAAASAAAQGLGAAVGAAQTAADLAAAALQMCMGKDHWIPPGLPIGNFLTGSPNVLIGGFPMPGYLAVLRGLGKLSKPLARKVQLRLPENSRLKNALCAVTGHPVDIASGRVFTTQRDFELDARTPIEFERAYDTSAVDYVGPFGPGWIHPYDIHLWEDRPQGMLILRNEEARLVGFEPLAIGEKAFHPIEKQWLERLDEKVYVVRDPDGRRRRFECIDSLGESKDGESGTTESRALRLVSIQDRNQNQITLQYQDGRLHTMEDSAGRRIIFSYTTLENGATRLGAIHQALDNAGNRKARLSVYSYDPTGHLISATDRGQIPRRYAYERDLLVRETNRNGLSFYFAYEGEGRDARCIHTWGDRGIYKRLLTYDRPAKKTIVEDSLGNQSSYYFNALDQPLSIVDPMGGVRRFEYGPNGELLSETDEIGHATAYGYNETGDCLSVSYPDGTTRRFEYTEDSLPITLVDEAGSKFDRDYDPQGNVIATIDALGARLEYGYNSSGDLVEARDPLGGVTRFKWNEHGQIVEFRSPTGALSRYRYDDRGRLAEVSDPLGNTTRYAYDLQDRLVQLRRPDGSKNHYEYDPEGNLTLFRDGNGYETRFRYVDYNKLGERIDALNYVRRFVYDTEANLVEVRNERGEACRFAYDALDRVTREVGFDGLTWNYQYDPAGQLFTRTDPAGRDTHFLRDRRGRVLERQRPDGSVIRFDYDPVGRITTAIAPGSEVGFEYDPLGQILSESQNGQVIRHQYDALGRRTRRRSPSGQTVDFAYDADSRLHRLQTPRGAMEFDYDSAGRLSRRRSPGDLEESYHYDPCGRLTEQALRGKNHLLFLRAYQYDAEGNLLELRDSNKGRSRYAYDPVERLSEVSQPERGLEQFFYDGTGNLLRRGERSFRYGAPDRLTQADEATFVYDEVGNLVEKRQGGKATQYRYDPDNRLLAVESEESGRVDFAYDAFGRRISKESDDGDVAFMWDGDVMLTEENAAHSFEYVFQGGGFEPLCRFESVDFESYHNDHLGTPREISDQQGRLIWAARYDAYGCIHLQQKNQSENCIRFQGQHDEPDIGLYYNRFRFYDPETARYISKDPIKLDGGLNNYAYVLNPLSWIDPLGLVKINVGDEGPINVEAYAGSPIGGKEHLPLHAHLLEGKLETRVLMEDYYKKGKLIANKGDVYPGDIAMTKAMKRAIKKNLDVYAIKTRSVFYTGKC
jgi:RHS repeat-associated protein